jgi:hypothetical protein
MYSLLGVRRPLPCWIGTNISHKSDTSIFNVYESLYYLEDGGRKLVRNGVSICQDPQRHIPKFFLVDAKNAYGAVDIYLRSFLTLALSFGSQLYALATLTLS